MRLETGPEIAVPLFIKEGEKLRVLPRLTSFPDERDRHT